MIDRLLGIEIQKYLQVLGLSILAFGVPMNKVLMSIGTIWLAANLLLRADFKNDWKKWKKSPVFWFIIAILGLHIIGLIYTSDFSYAFKDFNAKLPLFVIPIALIAFPIEKVFLKYIFYAFLLSIFITSFINFQFIIENGTSNYRNFSLFGSHIRYSLIVVTGILVAFALFWQNKKEWWIFFPIMSWFLYYTLISQVLNGYIAFLALLLGFIIYFTGLIKQKKIKYSVAITSIFFIVLSVYFFMQEIKPLKKKINFSEWSKQSKNGELYYHDTVSRWFENGHHILSFIANEELKEAWNDRTSSLRYYDRYEDGYLVKDILIRYMTSIGLTKDKEGIEKMTQEDVENVEKGIPTVVNTYPPIKRNIHILRNELLQYQMGGTPNGNSLLERFEHWKAAKGIIAQNWLLGVGTGDVQSVFDAEYQRSHTLLNKENWNRAHNQFLTFWISFGIFGFLIFAGFWGYFLFVHIRTKNLIGIGFTCIAITSFLSEDTIETQQGVTYIALFIGLTFLIHLFSTENVQVETNTNAMMNKLKNK